MKYTDSLPFFANHKPITQTDIYKELTTVKDGSLAQELLVRCEAGISEADFNELMTTDDFQKAIEALAIAHKEKDKDLIIKRLFGVATIFYRLATLDEKVPWEVIKKRFPCLALPGLEPDECRGARKPCKRILGRYYETVLETVLIRQDIRCRPNGIFADRLITAVELGVPYERLSSYMDIDLDAALDVLKEFFPDITREKIEKLCSDHNQLWLCFTKKDT